MNLRPFKLYRVYLEQFNSSNVMLYPCSNKERKICRRMSTSTTKRPIGRFHVVVVQWTSKKCTKSVMHERSCCFAHKFDSFFDVVVVVVVVVVVS